MFVRGINCAYISKISDCIVELFHKSGIFFTLLLETGHWNRITTGRKWKKPPTPLFIVIIINIWCNIHYQYISDAYAFFCILIS
jgi:hypothetical protein